MKDKKDHLSVSYCNLKRAYKIECNKAKKATLHPDEALANSLLYHDSSSKKSKELKKTLASA